MRPLAVFLLAAAALVLGGCANPDTQQSTLPWNQSQSWEGNGPAGSALGR